MRLTIAGMFAALLAPGCTAEPFERLSVSAAAIAGGVPAPEDTAVVGIYDDASGATCTGALIAPNVVLTAQHCVAELPQTFDCATSMFGPPKSAASFHVTTKPTFGFSPSDYHAVAQLLVPQGGAALCGDDVAMLVLVDLIDAAEAEPLVPRVDLIASTGEPYSAIGFGATDDNGTGAGERRRRDDLVIACGGPGCETAWMAASEWLGDAGVCGGDSGGPAIDAIGRVVGVASRGSAGCIAPIYGDVAAHADWIETETQAAATDAGYPPPPWSTGAPTDASGGAGGAAAATGGAGGATGGDEGGGGAAGSASTSTGGAATAQEPDSMTSDLGTRDEGCTCRATTATARFPSIASLAIAALLLRLRARFRGRRATRR